MSDFLLTSNSLIDDYLPPVPRPPLASRKIIKLKKMQEVLSQTHHIGIANQTEWKLYNTGKDYQWSCVDVDRAAESVVSPVIFSRITERYPSVAESPKTPEDVFFFKFRRAGKFILHFSDATVTSDNAETCEITFEIH